MCVRVRESVCVLVTHVSADTLLLTLGNIDWTLTVSVCQPH